jgi:hypothetical protein
MLEEDLVEDFVLLLHQEHQEVVDQVEEMVVQQEPQEQLILEAEQEQVV